MDNQEKSVSYRYTHNQQEKSGQVPYIEIELAEAIIRAISDVVIPGDIPAQPRGQKQNSGDAYYAGRLLQEGVADEVKAFMPDGSPYQIKLSAYTSPKTE